MTRMHFEAIAATLASLKPDRGNKFAPRSVKTKGATAFEQWMATVNAFTTMLSGTNDRFNSARFRRACGVEEGD